LDSPLSIRIFYFQCRIKENIIHLWYYILWNHLISLAWNFVVWHWTCFWTLEFVDFQYYAILFKWISSSLGCSILGFQFQWNTQNEMSNEYKWFRSMWIWWSLYAVVGLLGEKMTNGPLMGPVNPFSMSSSPDTIKHRYEET